MGLAPYGKPTHLDAMRKIILLQNDGTFKLNLRYFRHATQNLPHHWSNGVPVVGEHWSTELESLLGPCRHSDQPLDARHHDIAHSAQAMYEMAFFHMLNSMHRKYPVDQLCIAGGCGANSVANGKVSLHTPYSKVYVQAAAGDAGGALGAAMDVWHHLGHPRMSPMRHAYLGYQAKPDEIEQLIENPATKGVLIKENCKVQKLEQSLLCETIARAISEGLVVGWYQGRMEWGPRALGHRSILGDPRRADMKDILNLKIKRRESFRPFAPSILREEVDQWFCQDADVPFMMQVLTIKEDKKCLIPAVTHVDGTGRLQTVSELDNGCYYNLIRSFAKQTGVPIILNTSFNENEPIVCTPSEALDCFLRTRMDILVLNNTVIQRSLSVKADVASSNELY